MQGTTDAGLYDLGRPVPILIIVLSRMTHRDKRDHDGRAAAPAGFLQARNGMMNRS
ncbi:hypothetical protein [Methylobacterium sp. NFXW15]|uniref:hypothetical protein n=1 Tax=Methylobacterium sp. NFXW15 TaxID=2819512 RepID=UPI003CF976BD